jgi:predicted Zn-dependent peptidase
MLDRTVAPPFVKSANYYLPSFSLKTLANGCSLVVLPSVQQELIKIELVFYAGKWFESFPGQAHFTAMMLEKGTPTKSALEIATFFDHQGAQIEISPGLDFTSISLYSLTRNAERTFKYLLSIIRESSFPEEELSLQKDIFVQNLRVNQEKNSFVAGQWIRKLLFGNRHPYGNSLTAEDVQMLTRLHLTQYASNFLTPVAVFVTTNNSVNGEFVQSALEESPLLNKDTTTSHVRQSSTQFVHTLDKKESIQSAIRIACLSLNRIHPEYPHLLLLNHILGGYFGSRLMKNIREKKGLTYGISSSVNPLGRESFFVSGAEVNKGNVSIAVEEIMKEIQELQQKSISESELLIAKNHLLGSLQQDLSNPFSVMDKIRNIILFNLPHSHYSNLYTTVDRINSFELQSLARNHFSMSQFHRVLVG